MPLPPGVKDDEKDDEADRDDHQEAARLPQAVGTRLRQGVRAGRASASPSYEAQIADQVLGEKGKDGKIPAESLGYQRREITDAAARCYDRPAIEELIRWRLWDRTGAGLMAELGSHQLDAASIFISAMHGGKKQHPLRVVAAANRPIFGVDRDVEDHVYCMIEFPAPGYDARGPEDPPQEDRGPVFLDQRQRLRRLRRDRLRHQGHADPGEGAGADRLSGLEDGEHERRADHDQGFAAVGGGPTMDTQASGPAQAAADGGVSRGYAEELEHWAWCIRHPSPENKPRCHPKVAMADAIIALTTNMAAEQGTPIEFKEDVVRSRQRRNARGDQARREARRDLRAANSAV